MALMCFDVEDEEGNGKVSSSFCLKEATRKSIDFSGPMANGFH